MSKGKNVFYAMIICVIGMFMIGCGGDYDSNKDNTTNSEQTLKEYVLFFSHDLNKSELLQLVSDYNLQNISELRFKIGNITAGYATRSNNIEAELEQGIQKHIEHTEKLLQLEKSYSSEEKNAMMNNSIALAYKRSFVIPGVNIKNPDEDTLSKLRSDGFVGKFFIRGERKKGSEAGIGNKNFALLIDDSWAPDYGWNSVTQDYTYQRFAFDDTSGFDDTHGYEHETHVYSTQFVEYGGYWGTDMPNGYLDTQILDSG